MFYLTTTLEPKDKDEFDIVSISFMRKEDEDTDENGNYKFVYSGWYRDRGDKNYPFKGYVYASRKDNILKIISDICLSALNSV